LFFATLSTEAPGAFQVHFVYLSLQRWVAVPVATEEAFV
jgi:hypothetical protein